MMSKGLILVLVFLTPLCLLTCEEEKPLQTGEKTNEELIMEQFNAFKQAFEKQDIDGVMEIIADKYWDPYNQSKESYRNWLQGVFSGWTWKSVEMKIVGDITVVPGTHWAHQEPTNATADHYEETKIYAVNSSQDLLMTVKADLLFKWEFLSKVWSIIKISGTTGRVITSPSSVSPGSEVSVSVFTLPEGAPLDQYNTKSATLKDWNGDPILIQDQGNGRYEGTFIAPSTPGEYTLIATVSDTTFDKTLQIEHVLVVK